MIQVKVEKHHAKYQKVTILGHALYDDYGKDIVCSAASSIVTTTVNVGAAQGETKVEDIKLSEIFANDTITLVPGESYDLDDLLTVSPVAATNKELNYGAASDSNSIYSLDGSVVTATAKGTSTLTVNSADGNATKTLTITYGSKTISYDIEVKENGVASIKVLTLKQNYFVGDAFEEGTLV